MMSDSIAKAVIGDWKGILINALIEEYKAIHLYDEFLVRKPADYMAEVVKEIRNDEWNHIGRLQDLIKGFMSTEEQVAMKKGMSQEE